MKIIICCCFCLILYSWVPLFVWIINTLKGLISTAPRPCLQYSAVTNKVKEACWLSKLSDAQPDPHSAAALASVHPLASDTSGGVAPFVDLLLYFLPPHLGQPQSLCSRAEVLFDKGSWKAWTYRGVLALPALWTCCSLKALRMVRCEQGVWREPGPPKSISNMTVNFVS